MSSAGNWDALESYFPEKANPAVTPYIAAPRVFLPVAGFLTWILGARVFYSPSVEMNSHGTVSAPDDAPPRRPIRLATSVPALARHWRAGHRTSPRSNARSIER